ncbi:metal-dependent hydrolase [Haladaptatus sp. NG-SE-30]
MNKLGHWGIVLFVFGFVVFGLVARNKLRGAKIVTVTGLLMGVSPDIDLRIAELAHRGITHTVPAALVAGVVLAVIAFSFKPFALSGRREEAFYGFLTGFVGVSCHLVGDLITPMGIKFFYPFVERSYTLDLVHAHYQPANLALLVLGVMTFQTTVRHARTSDPVPTYAAGFRRSDFGLDTETETDVDA